MDKHNLMKDMVGGNLLKYADDYIQAYQTTVNALNVHNLMSGNFKDVKAEKDGSLKIEFTGMNATQATELLNRIKEYLGTNR